MKKFFILSLLALTACGTQPQLSEIVNDMVVLTNYDTRVDFKDYATYALTMDTVGFISNTSNQSALVNEYAKQITAQIKKNLDQSGRTKAADSVADIGVNVLIINDLSVSQSVIYPGGYGGYYPGYYGYGYGGYYGGYISTNYFQQAILVVEFADLKNKGAGDPVIVWSCNIGDLINSYDTSTKTKEAIDQAFVQSPYLAK